MCKSHLQKVQGFCFCQLLKNVTHQSSSECVPTIKTVNWSKYSCVVVVYKLKAVAAICATVRLPCSYG